MILDSDVLIDLLRGNGNALTWLSALSEMPCISGIAALEILFGAKDSADLRRVERFVALFPIAWPTTEDLESAQSYSRFRLSSGIGVLDAVTACLVLRLNDVLATFNVKHFVGLPGIQLVQPYAR